MDVTITAQEIVISELVSTVDELKNDLLSFKSAHYKIKYSHGGGYGLG